MNSCSVAGNKNQSLPFRRLELFPNKAFMKLWYLERKSTISSHRVNHKLFNDSHCLDKSI